MGGNVAPLLNVRGWAYAKEPGLSPFILPRATMLEPDLQQENLEDGRQLDELLVQHPSWPGVKTFSSSLTAWFHEGLVTELGELIKNSVGKESSNAALTIGAGGHTDGTIVMLDTNLPPPIVLVTGDDGKKYDRAVKAFDTGTKVLTLAQKLPSGVLPTAVANPFSVNGACWQEDPLAAVDTYRVEFDRRGKTNETKGFGETCVPSQFQLKFDPKGRLGAEINFLGGAWTIGSAPNVQGVGKILQQYLSFHGTCFYQDLATPVAPVTLRLRGIDGLDLAPEFVPLTSQTGVDGDDDDPESDLFDWERGVMKQGLNLQLALPDPALYAARAGMGAKSLYLRFKSKVGGAAGPQKVLAFWFPEVVQNDNPKPGQNGGIEAHDIALHVGQTTLISSTNGLLTKCAVAVMDL